MAAYKLVKIGSSYCVEGLASPGGGSDTMLIAWGAEDCDTVSRDGKAMHSALYDLYQTHDGLKNGDTFAIRGKVKYVCEGVHVVKV